MNMKHTFYVGVSMFDLTHEHDMGFCGLRLGLSRFES